MTHFQTSQGYNKDYVDDKQDDKSWRINIFLDKFYKDLVNEVYFYFQVLLFL